MSPVIVGIELTGLLICVLVLALGARSRGPEPMQRPVLLGLVGATAIVHITEVLEWSGVASAPSWGEPFATLLPVLWVFLVTGISRDRLLHEMHTQKAQLELVLAQAPTAIALFDADKRYLACSKSWRRTYHPGEEGPAAGLDLCRASSPLAEAVRTAMREVERSGGADSDGPVPVEAGGTTEWLSWAGKVWRRTDHHAGGMVMIADLVTNQVHADEELRDAEERVAHDNRVDLVGVLASGIAHDVRNFLTVVTAHVDVVEDGGFSDAEVAASVEQTRGALAASTKLLGELTSLSRVQVDALERFDLNELVRGSKTLVERALGSRITLEVQTDTDPVIVLASRVKLQQVVLNLVINARDAMAEDGCIRLEVERREVTGRDIGVLSVIDDGAGMTPETQARMFEQHFTTKALGKGSGLGLAIVRRVVEEHGGNVFVRSALGQGTTIEVRLPVAGDMPLPSSDQIRAVTPECA